MRWPLSAAKYLAAMTESFKHYEREARAALARLSPRQRILFALLVCRRHKPYYLAWTGDAALFDDVEQVLLGRNADLDVLRQRVDGAYPSEDRVDDDDVVWLALNGLDACLHALRVLESPEDLDGVWGLACFCYDAADRAAGLDILPNGGVHTPEVETAIAQSAPVRRELEWQFEVFGQLAAIGADEPVPMTLIGEKAAEPLLGHILSDDVRRD